MRCVIYLRVSTERQADRDLTEEGFSLPAQREACVRHIRDQGWTVTDEYSDRGESARSADRPQLKAMLARVAEDRDVDAVVVHKIDRLARNVEDHVAIRAALRRANVALVSVTERLEETASGRLVEGIHAVMAEFYSANLSSEIRKGLSQKAKQGGWPHAAPLGYHNLRELVGGRQVARIVPDAERAPLIRVAFELYATGEWTLERLGTELAHRGLTGRARKNSEAKPLTLNGLSTVLRNKAYKGVVEWDGIDYPGSHEPLIDPATFAQVQTLLEARSVRGTRERKHHHYLKGLLHCGVCGRRLSVQHSKGRYLYFFCLGQKNDPASTCRERYIATDRLEDAVAALYQRLQLPAAIVDVIREGLEAEFIAREHHSAAEREYQSKRLAKIDVQRRKLLDAYYANAIDVATLKAEQDRLGRDAHTVQDRLAALDANLSDARDVLGTAIGFAGDCATAYRKANEATRKQLNDTVFTRIDVTDGHVTGWEARPLFDELFKGSEFEYGSLVELWGIEPQASSMRPRRSTN